MKKLITNIFFSVLYIGMATDVHAFEFNTDNFRLDWTADKEKKSISKNKNKNKKSAYGKYKFLLQTLHCPKDKKTYGKYRDYGYYGGGKWCGKKAKAGYWVWSAPKWYVWKKVTNRKASANGKYKNLIQTLHCPKDKKNYGKYKDYGYYGGGSWCGKKAKAGYWVWEAPTWYVWKEK